MQPKLVTADRNWNDQLLYFTGSSLLGDDDGLVFISNRTGHPNLFFRRLSSSEECQLTFNTQGFLKSYVYFDGTPYAGFGKASASLHPQSGTVYYIQGPEVHRLEISGDDRILVMLPDDQMTAYTHVSADNTRLVIPTTDARALEGNRKLSGKPEYDIDGRVRAEGLYSYLHVYDARSGEELRCEPVHKAWITHVQFSPKDRNVILYNHEWPSDCGVRRMWIWDGRSHIRLRSEGDGRSPSDWTCHEFWESTGIGVVYHGSYVGGTMYLGRVSPDGLNRTEIPLPAEYTGYGHFTVGKTGTLVSDGYYHQGEGGHKWISCQRVNWEGRTVRWIPLCRHESSWRNQCCHPHPIFNHNCDFVYFTSDVGGSRAVYRIAVPGD